MSLGFCFREYLAIFYHLDFLLLGQSFRLTKWVFHFLCVVCPENVKMEERPPFFCLDFGFISFLIMFEVWVSHIHPFFNGICEYSPLFTTIHNQIEYKK